MHKSRDFIAHPNNLDNSLYKFFVESTQYYVSIPETTYVMIPMYFPLPSKDSPTLWLPALTGTPSMALDYLTACSLALSATSQQYFSLRTNQSQAINQQYFSLRTNQHQPSATSQTNRLSGGTAAGFPESW
jgi:hypothetical protein